LAATAVAAHPAAVVLAVAQGALAVATALAAVAALVQVGPAVRAKYLNLERRPEFLLFMKFRPAA
jgi:hypothetical protein